MTAPPARCDTLVAADTVMTSDPANPQIDGAAIAITDARIAWLGPALTAGAVPTPSPA